MVNFSIAAQIRKLTSLVNHHIDLYYNKNSPEIFDREFDKLYKQLVELEVKYPQYASKNSPIKKVSRDSDQFFKKVKHPYPMLSLENTYNRGEVSKFLVSIGSSTKVTIEDKIDGCAIELIYKNGKLHQGITRGDGEIGDDITKNILNISNIPHKIPITADVIIRGEAVILKEDFEKINLASIKKYANSRNLTSGTIKSHNPRVIVDRNVVFYAYEVVGLSLSTQLEILQWLIKQGFNIPLWVVVDQEEVLQHLSLCELLRYDLKYDVDGAVIKVNSIKLRESLGKTNRAPNWATAFKFEAEKVISTILDIEYGIGRTGAITPVAILEPVSLCGTIVKRATLHNRDYINGLGISIGSRVYIEKGGEIIPKVVSRVEGDKPRKHTFPDECPYCRSRLLFSKDAKVYCPDFNGTCEQNVEKLIHFVSKDALNVIGLGDEICRMLVNSKKAKNLTNIFDITEEDLLELDRIGDKTAKKLYKAIQNSRNTPFERVLYGIGIPGLGFILAKQLSSTYPTWHKLSKASVNEIKQLEGFGDVLSESVYNYLKQHKTYIQAIRRVGIKQKFSKSSSSTKLVGKCITITGSFDDYTRDMLVGEVENMGATYSKSVTSKTTHLLCGDNVGNNKIQEATRRSIEVLSKSETYKLLGI